LGAGPFFFPIFWGFSQRPASPLKTPESISWEPCSHVFLGLPCCLSAGAGCVEPGQSPAVCSPPLAPCLGPVLRRPSGRGGLKERYDPNWPAQLRAAWKQRLSSAPLCLLRREGHRAAIQAVRSTRKKRQGQLLSVPVAKAALVQRSSAKFRQPTGLAKFSGKPFAAMRWSPKNLHFKLIPAPAPKYHCRRWRWPPGACLQTTAPVSHRQALLQQRRSHWNFIPG